MKPTDEDQKFIERLRDAIAAEPDPDKQSQLSDELGDMLHCHVVADMLDDGNEEHGGDPARPSPSGPAPSGGQPPPSCDQTMSLLAMIPENYSWVTFKPILEDPARLKAWVLEKIQPEPVRYLNPEDPAVVELSELTADTEHAAAMFCSDLAPEDKAKLKAAFVALWGPAGAASLPF